MRNKRPVTKVQLAGAWLLPVVYLAIVLFPNDNPATRSWLMWLAVPVWLLYAILRTRQYLRPERAG